MAPPGANTLSQAQLDRCAEITNQRGAQFEFTVAGAPPILAHYSFEQAYLDSNQLHIKVRKESNSSVIDGKRAGKPPIPEPPSSELDDLINSVVDLIEREYSLKPDA